jgi:hypothetical protein
MPPAKPRFDGWTPSRQLVFLEVLARTRSVAASAKAVGMSREGAYRLRRRPDAGLFAAAWDRAMSAGLTVVSRAKVDQGHKGLNARACNTEGAAPT